MADTSNPVRTCPLCGTAVSSAAAVCPACSSVMPADDEGDACLFCGTGMFEGRCPVCGSEHQAENPAASARRWTYLAVSLAVVLVLGSAWLARPWADLESPPQTDVRAQYQSIPTPTLTRTPTATATNTATSTPTVTPTPTATPMFLSYSVVRGDTASGIAVKYNITTAELFQANDLTEHDILSIGQVLRIPTGGASPDTATPAEPSTEPTLAATELGPAPTATVPATATTVPSATPAPTQGNVTHTVVAGEHLGVIARRYDLSQEDIARANNIGVDDILSIGQQLVIPLAPSGDDASAAATVSPSRAPIEHIVQEGDLLGRIAIRYDVSTEDLARANSISVTSILRVGQVLIIPGTVSEPTATPRPSATHTPASQALVESLTGITASTATPRPAATEEAERYSYPRPNLLGPISGSEFRGADSAILLSWTSSGILAENVWYQLRVWSAESGGDDITLWTKATSWRVPGAMYRASAVNGTFWWKVSVAHRPPEQGEPETLSADSQVYKFVWK